MTDPMAPADLYRRSLRLLLDKDIDGWVDLCDENVIFEFPYDMPYVAVVTVSNGHITHYRDYWSPSAIPGALDDAKFFPDER